MLGQEATAAELKARADKAAEQAGLSALAMSAGRDPAVVEGYLPRTGRAGHASSAIPNTQPPTGKSVAADRAGEKPLGSGVQASEAPASMLHLPAEELDAFTVGQGLAVSTATAAAAPTGSPEHLGAAVDMAGSAEITANREGAGGGSRVGHGLVAHGRDTPGTQLEQAVLVTSFVCVVSTLQGMKFTGGL